MEYPAALGASCACVIEADEEQPGGWAPCPYQLCERDDHFHNAALAWAAGIFDGEGTVTWTNGRRNKTLRIAVAQSGSAEIPARFRDCVGLGNVHGPYGPYGTGSSRKPQFVWNANGADAHAVMGTLWPYLSSPKREKYEAIRREVL